MDILSSIFSLAIFIAGGKTTQTSKITSVENTSVVQSDSIALQNLTRELYKWENSQKLKDDFVPIKTAKNGMYQGIDLVHHKKRLELFKQSKLFASDFINLYEKIGKTLNLLLEKQQLKWEVGDLPPFGNGANFWCDCQDTPTDDYYKYLVISDLKITDTIATFVWKWDKNTKDFSYQIKAKKENGKWKIASLQGFEELNKNIKELNNSN